MSLLVACGQRVFNLLCIYAPAGITARKEFIRDLHQYFYTGVPVIVGGDFNCIENTADQFGHATDACKAGGVELTALKANFDLIDIWRQQHRNVKQYTWWKKDCSVGSRLDKFLIDKRFLEVRNSTIEPCVLSDHEYVSISMKLTATPRMSHLWKLNVSNLEDPEYTRLIEQTLDKAIQRKTHSPSLQEWWDELKQNIRTTTQTYDKQKRKRDKEHQDRLTRNIIKLKRTFDPQNKQQIQQITDLETTLRELKFQKMEGAKIRSRVQWIEQGEKPTKYFYNLEKQRAKTNSMDSVRDDNDNEVTDPNTIKTVVTDFYTNLYKKDMIDMNEQNQLLTNLSRKLNRTESQQCEGDLSLEEATNAIQEAKNGKSPGKDGLPPEFYKRFWDKLGPELVTVLNEGYEKGHLAPTQQESIIRLLYKKDDRTYLKNWRPISLLNADYKIATKILTNRLKRVLESLINEDQTCAIPNRDISNNLNLIRDVLDYTERTHETGILLSLDQEKAFDRVDRSLLHNVLRRFGFGPSFTRWISTIYAGASAQVICNGELTETIPLERGVRQGCPLSPALYVLVAEVLGETIRTDKTITGFLLPGAHGKEFRLAQYADDTTLYIKTDRSLQQVLNVVQRYENASGARLNKTKTEAMWLGQWSGRTDTPHGLKWVKKMRILGIVFGHGEVETDNWSPKLAKLEKSLNVWRTRELSLIGKALIINTIGASRFWYAARVLPVPKWVVLQYEKLVWAFIWKTKVQPVARKTMIGPIQEGGIGMVDLATKSKALRASTIAKGACRANNNWHYMLKYFVGTQLAQIRPVWAHLRDNKTPSAEKPTPFLQLCIETLRETKHSDTKDIYNELLKLVFQVPKPAIRWGIQANCQWKTLWQRVRQRIAENKKNDLLWTIVHRGVKVRDRLYEWQVTRNRNCATCGKPETISHCFLECKRVRKVWRTFTPLLRELAGPFAPEVQSVFLLTFTDPKESKLCKQASYIIKTILYWIWHARNHATFNNEVESHRDITNYIKKDMDFRFKFSATGLNEAKELYYELLI